MPAKFSLLYFSILIILLGYRSFHFPMSSSKTFSLLHWVVFSPLISPFIYRTFLNSFDLVFYLENLFTSSNRLFPSSFSWMNCFRIFFVHLVSYISFILYFIFTWRLFPFIFYLKLTVLVRKNFSLVLYLLFTQFISVSFLR